MVPEGWKIKALSDIAAVERGKFSVRPRNDPQYYGGAIPFIQTGDVATSGGRITSYSQTLNERGLAVSRLFPKGTIFITIAANIGNAAIAEFDTACPDSIVAVQPTDDTSVMWLLHVLMLEQPKLDAYASQNAQKNINLETLRPLPILTPPNEEQHRIAAILSTWDTAITQTEKLIEANRKLKKGLMQQLLTGKRRFPEFNNSWEKVRLKDVCKIVYGKSQNAIVSEDGPYPIWGTGGIVGYAEEYLYDKPSVILGRKGTIDHPYMSAKPFWAIDTTFYTEIKDGIDPQWLYQRFLLIPWRKYNEASGVPSLSRETIYKIRIDVPDTEEQRKIAAVLNEVDRQIESLVRLSKNFEEQKRGLMQKLLTGQIRVKATGEITA